MGSLAYDNWHSARNGVPLASTFEYPLFSDCEIVGELAEGFGPYEILNSVPDERVGTSAIRAFLRVSFHSSPYADDIVDPGSDHDHGGVIQDEIAALLSLCLGARIRAGASTRLFQPGRDPRGRPHAFTLYGERIPVLARSSRPPTIPRILERKDFSQGELVLHFSKLSPGHSIHVARAARLYQDALWVADSEPELSWLMLVSAVETAANSWDQQKENSTEALKATAYGKKLEELFLAYNKEELFGPVAELLTPVTGSTRKFRSFLSHFSPPPPDLRPEDANRRLSWSKRKLRDAFDKIYEHRSKALHSGRPFPAPMSWPPGLVGDSLDEKLVGGRAGSRGAMWDAEDIPMLLSTFEYIVRNALLSWWRTNLV